LDNFELIHSDIPDVKDGELLIKTIWMSLDPYMRGRIKENSQLGLGALPHPIGHTMPGGSIGRVVFSRNPNIPIGSFVDSPSGWQDYFVSNSNNIRLLNSESAPLSTNLGILGMPGLTAYHGLFEIGKPQVGETIVVSAASGAVGAVVGQLGKLSGCRVIGIAGTDEKISYIKNDLGFDAAINYKTESVEQKLSEYCTHGVDIYFDNVGGTISDAVIDLIADRGRVIVCGQISQYNLPEQDTGPRNLWQLLRHQATIEGFTVGRYANRSNVARQRLTTLVQENKLKYKEDIIEGLENAPSAFIGMMSGQNFGKLLIKVSNE
jgi:NADPH-dependent curcumin reductase CurA